VTDPDAVPHPGEPLFRPLGERVLYEGHVISLAVGTFEAPDGSRFERELVHHPGAVSVVPLHDDGSVTLVRQYRAPLDAELLEIPAGKCDVAGEPAEVTAERELAEEVGLRAGRLDLLAEFLTSPGFSDEHSWTFLARDLESVELDLQGVEEQHMEALRVPLSAVPAMIQAGELLDAKTIIGLTLAAQRLAWDGA
jgi:8-oxo-dGTP pyrophosphatase MutT (NUDIX family)